MIVALVAFVILGAAALAEPRKGRDRYVCGCHACSHLPSYAFLADLLTIAASALSICVASTGYFPPSTFEFLGLRWLAKFTMYILGLTLSSNSGVSRNPAAPSARVSWMTLMSSASLASPARKISVFIFASIAAAQLRAQVFGRQRLALPGAVAAGLLNKGRKLTESFFAGL